MCEWYTRLYSLFFVLYISHYKVFAVPMKEETDIPINSRFIPLVQSSKLLKHAVSPQVLTHESSPTPFLVGTYQFRKLPKSIVFNGNEMRLSFKPKTHYSFITAVFTKAEVSKSDNSQFCITCSFILIRLISSFTLCRVRNQKDFIPLVLQQILQSSSVRFSLKIYVLLWTKFYFPRKRLEVQELNYY